MRGSEKTELKETILIVDDKEINRAVLRETFKDEYNVEEAGNGQEAVSYILKNGRSVCAILLDIVMPVMDGFEFLEKFAVLGLKGKIPVFLITADISESNMYRGYNLSVMDIIEKPIVPFFVKRRVNSVIELYRTRKALSDLVKVQYGKIKEKDKEILELNYAIIETLSTAIEFRSGESGSHVKRIGSLTKLMLNELRSKDPEKYPFTDEQIEQIAVASIMHDVGKIAISDAILNKPGKLTEKEYEIIKTHTTKGCEILESIPKYKDNPIYKYAYDICRHHHERWDGKGYPDRLKGSEIPLWAQIVSIADVYDALTTKRVYKEAYPADEAIRMICEGECGEFNPELLDALISILRVYKPIISN